MDKLGLRTRLEKAIAGGPSVNERMGNQSDGVVMEPR